LRVERRAEPEPPAAGGQECQENDRCGQQLVEDLAVDVDVVPDDVRLQRRDQRRGEPGARRDEAAADLVDEQRGRDGDGGLR